MTLVAEEVIREARDLSPSYEERKHPNGVMLRAIDSYEKDVANQVARTYPSILAEILNVPLPLADFSSGERLFIQDDPQPPDPDAPPERKPIYVLPGMALSNAQGVSQEAELVNLTLRNRPADYCGRVGWLENGRLYLSGTEKSWQGFTNIELTVVAESVEITSLKDTLRMPDWCHDLYVGAMLKIMAIRERDEAGMAIGNGMQDDVWATIAQQKSAESFVTVDSWPGGF